jgi:hypothetical protein
MQAGVREEGEVMPAECSFSEYVLRYLRPVRELCRLGMPEDIGTCMDKAARPYYYWLEECKRRGALPSVP